MVLKVILVLIILMLIVGAILMSSIYVVRQQSVAIIERFGKYQKLSNSGIHLRAPLGLIKLQLVYNCVSCKVKSLWKPRLKITYL